MLKCTYDEARNLERCIWLCHAWSSYVHSGLFWCWQDKSVKLDQWSFEQKKWSELLRRGSYERQDPTDLASFWRRWSLCYVGWHLIFILHCWGGFLVCCETQVECLNELAKDKSKETYEWVGTLGNPYYSHRRYYEKIHFWRWKEANCYRSRNDHRPAAPTSWRAHIWPG